MKKNFSKRREMILLAIPFVAFVLWCLWLQFRQPFKLVVDEITVALVPPSRAFGKTPGERQVAVEIFLDHEGMKPLWWGKSANLWRSRVRFSGKGQSDDGSNIGSYTSPLYDENRGQYYILFNGWVPDSPNYLKTATCHISGGLANQKFPASPLAMLDDISIPASQFEVPAEIKTIMP